MYVCGVVLFLVFGVVVVGVGSGVPGKPKVPPGKKVPPVKVPPGKKKVPPGTVFPEMPRILRDPKKRKLM